MVQLRRKPKHRATHSYLRAAWLDLYAVAHRIANSRDLNRYTRPIAVFFVRVVEPRPAQHLYTKRVKNLKQPQERT